MRSGSSGRLGKIGLGHAKLGKVELGYRIGSDGIIEWGLVETFPVSQLRGLIGVASFVSFSATALAK